LAPVGFVALGAEVQSAASALTVVPEHPAQFTGLALFGEHLPSSVSERVVEEEVFERRGFAATLAVTGAVMARRG
jgi:hypothetical protein